jgi:hypothetical protein
MKNALARLLSSAKFLTTLLGLFTTAGASLLAKHGLELSDATIQQVAITVSGFFGLLLAAQGATDMGKSAAAIGAQPAQPTPRAVTAETADPGGAA